MCQCPSFILLIYPKDPVNSPMFGGSPYGRGGNGNHEAYNYINAITSTATPPLNCIHPETGRRSWMC